MKTIIRCNCFESKCVYGIKSYLIKLKSDCIYHAPIDLELNGQSIGKW